MKKKFTRMNVALVLSVLFASCSQEQENELLPQVGKRVAFNIGITQTRTSTTDKKTVFVDEDAIGIFGVKRGASELLNTNVKYTYQGEEWTTETSLTFPLDGSNVNFYAYYPHRIATATTFDFSVQQDQTVAGYDESDFLWAKNEVATSNDESIALQFAHAFALVEVSATGLQPDVTLTGVKLIAVQKASINLIAPSATVSTTDKAAAISMKSIGAGKFRAIVPAQTVSGTVLDLTTSDGTIYRYAPQAGVALTANQITNFSIDCAASAKKVEIVDPSIGDWGEGSNVEGSGDEFMPELITNPIASLPIGTWEALTSTQDISKLQAGEWGYVQKVGTITVGIENDATLDRNVLHANFGEKAGNAWFNAYLGHQMANAEKKVHTLRFKAKGTADNKLRFYIKYAKGTFLEASKRWGFAEIALTNDYSEYALDFNFAEVMTNGPYNDPTKILGLTEQDVLTSFFIGLYPTAANTEFYIDELSLTEKK